jgi:hypothetical protein
MLMDTFELILRASSSFQNGVFKMSVFNKCLGPTRIAICAGVVTLSFVAGAQSASADAWSYCRHRYGPSLTSTVRGINGTPCGIECTAREQARRAKIHHCVEMRQRARHHAP